MDDFSDLHFAASQGDLSAVKVLLAKGENVNAFDDIGFTPLHHAVKEEQLDVIYELLKSGADINAHDESQIGNTPLGEVAGHCSFKIAQLLVDHGADPTIEGWMQLSALDRARKRKKEEGLRVFELPTKVANHEYSRTSRCS